MHVAAVASAERERLIGPDVDVQTVEAAVRTVRTDYITPTRSPRPTCRIVSHGIFAFPIGVTRRATFGDAVATPCSTLMISLAWASRKSLTTLCLSEHLPQPTRITPNWPDGHR